MRTAFLSLVILVAATGAVMAGGNMSNKLPALLIVAGCAIVFLRIISPKARIRS